MITITYDELARTDACQSGLHLFREMFGEGGEITLEKCHRWVNETIYCHSGPLVVARCLGPLVESKFKADTLHPVDKIEVADALWNAIQHLHAMG